jgi:hypothetical protein
MVREVRDGAHLTRHVGKDGPTNPKLMKGARADAASMPSRAGLRSIRRATAIASGPQPCRAS